MLLTACSAGSDGGNSGNSSGGSAPKDSRSTTTDGVSEATKGKSCEQYRDLSAQVDAANTEVQGITVSSEADGEKVTELMTKVSDLTEKAQAAYALCYAEGTEPRDGAQ